jgi:response regulator RpfG family c-di-GMP phosphodiesterase
MDYRMPNMDGVEATGLLREAYGSQIKIIMVTASVLEHQEVMFTQSGVDETIRKPFTYQDIANVLVDYLGDDSFNIEMSHEIAPGTNSPEKTLALTDIRIPMALLNEMNEMVDCGLIIDLKEKLDELYEINAQLANLINSKVDSFELDEVAEIIRNLTPSAQVCEGSK